MRILKTLVLLFLVGCATTGGSIIPIKYQFTDLPTEQRIELRWRNDTNQTMCLLPEAWPNGGIVYEGRYRVFLVVDGQRFPMLEFGHWECTLADGCSVHVAPGEEVTASIPYKNFNLPKELTDHPKTLEFSAFAEPCPPQKPTPANFRNIGTYHFLTLLRRAGSERADAYDGLDRKLSEYNNDQGMTPVPRPRLMSCTYAVRALKRLPGSSGG